MDGSLPRAQALAQADSLLRAALDGQARARFDVEASASVQERTKDLVETLGFIGLDDRLWAWLADSHGALLERGELEALVALSDADLAPMLVACGYHSPPPPPVEELLADTRLAVAAAVQVGRVADPEVIQQARASLVTFVLRTRSQLDVVSTHADDAGVHAALGRRVGGVARQVLPIAVGAAAGTLVAGPFGGALAGLGVGHAVGYSVEQAVEAATAKGAELAVASAIGLAGPDASTTGARSAADEERSQVPSVDRAIMSHLALVQTGITALGRQPATTPRVAPRVLDHLRRVVTLANEHGAPPALASAAELAAEAVSVLAQSRTSASYQLRQPADLTDERVLGFAQSALEICLAVRGADSDLGPAAYVAEPFGGAADLAEPDPWLAAGLRDLWSNWSAATAGHT